MLNPNNNLEHKSNEWQRWILEQYPAATITGHQLSTLITKKISEPGLSTDDKMGLMHAEIEVEAAIRNRDL